MEITLKIDGKDRTYTAGFISARMVRKTVEISQELNFESLTPEELDRLIDYIAGLFSNQFTRDELYDGLASKDLVSTITNCINEVVGGMAEVTGGDGKNE